MYRFFEEADNLDGDTIKLSKENTHHIVNVLRIREDEDFEVVIGDRVYLSNIYMGQNKLMVAKVKEIYGDKNESNLHIHLYQGLPKSDKLEFIIQKTIELGCFQITPFTSSRTIVKWDDNKAQKKLKRYEEIALAAAKQSKRGLVPKVNRPVSFSKLLDDIEGAFTLLAYENGGKSLRNILKEYKGREINIIIGPEGGFSQEEVDQLEGRGAKVVHLGNRILRTETAAVALTAMVQYEIGDINEEI